MKRHQMRYYVRMREIEVISFALSGSELPDGSQVSTPLIDWGWQNAAAVFKGGARKWPPEGYSRQPSYTWAGFFPHVFLPHVITVMVGGTLFILGLTGILKMPLAHV